MFENAWQRELQALIQMEQRSREILGVRPGAAPEQLKRAYRELAKRYHPDRNPNDEEARERFKDVVAAYKLLSEGVRQPSLLDRREPLQWPAVAGYNIDNSWGYFLWWREGFF